MPPVTFRTPGVWGSPEITLADFKRFMSYVVVAQSGCWEWRGATDRRPGFGWGRFWFGGRAVKAHRFSAAAFGLLPLSSRRKWLHDCDNRICVNPNCGQPGTQKQNMRDMCRKGRHWRMALRAAA